MRAHWHPSLIAHTIKDCPRRASPVANTPFHQHCPYNGSMTTKERLHQLVDELSEAEAGETLRFAAARHEGSNVDEWGDLDAHMDTAMLEAVRDIDEEERAAGFSWEKHSRA